MMPQDSANVVSNGKDRTLSSGARIPGLDEEEARKAAELIQVRDDELTLCARLDAHIHLTIENIPWTSYATRAQRTWAGCLHQVD